jgi:hypothetical protein
LQLFALNEECLVQAIHQIAWITSLSFVHTARRCYRWLSNRGVGRLSSGTAEPHRYLTTRGSKSRNKVAVGEPAAGSLSYSKKVSRLITEDRERRGTQYTDPIPTGRLSKKRVSCQRPSATHTHRPSVLGPEHVVKPLTGASNWTPTDNETE